MAGEIITAKTLQEGLQQLHEIYKSKTKALIPITKDDYEKIQKSEREDSDNHLNLQRLGKETDVIDLAYYKFLPNHQTAFRINMIHVDGISTLEDYFILDGRID